MRRIAGVRVLCWVLLPAAAWLVAAGLMQPASLETQLLLAVPLSAALFGLMATRAQSPDRLSSARLCALAGWALTGSFVCANLAGRYFPSHILDNEEMQLLLAVPGSVVVFALRTPASGHRGGSAARWVSRGSWALGLALAWTGWASWFFAPPASGENWKALTDFAVFGTLGVVAVLLAALVDAYGRPHTEVPEQAVTVGPDAAEVLP